MQSMIYTTKAHQLFDLSKDAGRIKAKVLFIPVRSDLLFPPELSRHAVEELRAQGNIVDVIEIDSDGGHTDGGAAIIKAAETIHAFMER